jgi:hypothetical protein
MYVLSNVKYIPYIVYILLIFNTIYGIFVTITHLILQVPYPDPHQTYFQVLRPVS